MPSKSATQRLIRRGFAPINKTAAYTLTANDAGRVFTNLGASGGVTFSLPQTDLLGRYAGCRFTFVVKETQALTIDPGPTSGIYIGGSKLADDTTLVSSEIGETITLECDANDDWHILAIGGQWGLTDSVGVISSSSVTTPILIFNGLTGANEIRIPTNLADAWSLEDSAGDLIVITTTTGSQLITITPALTVTGLITANGGVALGDADDVTLGTGLDALIRWSTGDADNHSTVLALGDSNQAFHITDKAAVATDWNVAADTHPTVYVHSNTTPATDYMTFGAHDGTTGHINLAGGTTLSFDIAGTSEVTFTAAGIVIPATNSVAGAGTTLAAFIPTGAHTTSVAPAGAVPITNYYSTLDSTAGATTATLADGAQIGQLKKIQMIADNGDVVLTPANLAAGTTITFADVGDFCVLQWNGTDWTAIELGNDADGVTAPALA